MEHPLAVVPGPRACALPVEERLRHCILFTRCCILRRDSNKIGPTDVRCSRAVAFQCRRKKTGTHRLLPDEAFTHWCNHLYSRHNGCRRRSFLVPVRSGNIRRTWSLRKGTALLQLVSVWAFGEVSRWCRVAPRSVRVDLPAHKVHCEDVLRVGTVVVEQRAHRCSKSYSPNCTLLSVTDMQFMR